MVPILDEVFDNHLSFVTSNIAFQTPPIVETYEQIETNSGRYQKYGGERVVEMKRRLMVVKVKPVSTYGLRRRWPGDAVGVVGGGGWWHWWLVAVDLLILIMAGKLFHHEKKHRRTYRA